MERDHSGAFLYVLTAGVVLGVAFALIIPLGVVYLLVCMGIALALIMCGYVLAKRWPRKFSFHLFFLGALFLSALALGFIRADLFLMQQRASSLLPFVTTAKEKATVEGVVVDDPERRATSLHINVAVTNINDTAAHGELLAILGSDEQVQYGDTIVLQGSITEPQPFETNTGHLFDYEAYLQVQGISVMMPHAVIVEVTHNGFEPKFLLQTILFDTKHLFESSVEKLFPEPDGSLLEGILLGERRGMPQSLTQAFVASSLVHVVVLSGHNITIVSEGVFRALAFLPRTAGYGVGAVLMIAFALMTGAGATTMRALIMALVALLARYLHRSTLAMRSLAVASMGMVLWNPLSVLHDSSFILSVLATFGLITLAPWVEQKLWRIPNYKRFDLRSILATTIAVEIFVTPALLYFSGTFSFFALPANSIALPIVPFAMFAGFVAGLVGLVSPALALVPTLLCDAALKWLMLVATTTQSLPFSTATVAQFPAWVFFAVYVPLTVFAIFVYRRNVFESRTN